MIKYWLFFLLLFSFSASAQANVKNDSIIIWSKNRKIVWDDFLSHFRPVDTNYKDALAVISLSISFYPKELNCLNMDSIRITTQMHKNGSWVGKKIDNDIGLNHEQTHFDIAEVYARKIRKAIKKFIEENTTCDEKKLQEIVNIFNRLEEEHWQTQFLYDDEIRMCDEEDIEGIICFNLVKQKEWDEKTASLLEEYKCYELIIDISKLE